MTEQLPMDGREFVMTCAAEPLEAELRLHFVEDPAAEPLEGFGPGGKFVGEYRNNTEVYAVEIFGFYDVRNSCAYRKVYCWGAIEFEGYRGQLGCGSQCAASYTPVEAAGLTNARDVSAGAFHTCAATGDGRVYCWGENTYGEANPANVGGIMYRPMEVVIP